MIIKADISLDFSGYLSILREKIRGKIFAEPAATTTIPATAKSVELPEMIKPNPINATMDEIIRNKEDEILFKMSAPKNLDTINDTK